MAEDESQIHKPQQAEDKITQPKSHSRRLIGRRLYTPIRSVVANLESPPPAEPSSIWSSISQKLRQPATRREAITTGAIAGTAIGLGLGWGINRLFPPKNLEHRPSIPTSSELLRFLEKGQGSEDLTFATAHEVATLTVDLLTKTFPGLPPPETIRDSIFIIDTDPRENNQKSFGDTPFEPEMERNLITQLQQHYPGKNFSPPFLDGFRFYNMNPQHVTYYSNPQDKTTIYLLKNFNQPVIKDNRIRRESLLDYSPFYTKVTNINEINLDEYNRPSVHPEVDTVLMSHKKPSETEQRTPETEFRATVMKETFRIFTQAEWTAVPTTTQLIESLHRVSNPSWESDFEEQYVRNFEIMSKHIYVDQDEPKYGSSSSFNNFVINYLLYRTTKESGLNSFVIPQNPDSPQSPQDWETFGKLLDRIGLTDTELYQMYKNSELESFLQAFVDKIRTPDIITDSEKMDFLFDNLFFPAKPNFSEIEEAISLKHVV